MAKKLTLMMSLVVLPMLTLSPVVRGEEEAGDSKNKLTHGPKDPQQKTAPGPIDEDASAEFKKTDSGLKYRILRKSDQDKPNARNFVQVHYKGWLDDETIFDSSYRRDKKAGFPLNGVIPGWTEGLQFVGKGGMIELEIPASLAYGVRGRPGIPPNATLHFIVELFDIK